MARQFLPAVSGCCKDASHKHSHTVTQQKSLRDDDWKCCIIKKTKPYYVNDGT